MPYKRKGRGGFRRRGKRTGGWMGKAGSAISLAGRALKLAKYVASIVNVEYKFKDTEPLGSTRILLPNTGTFYLLTGVAQGDSDQQRNGNSIKGKSISVKVNAEAGSSTTNQRYILLLDKVSNGASPTAPMLLTGSQGVYDRYNGDNMGSRFIVLADRKISLGFNDTTNHYASGIENKNFSMFRKLFGHQKFQGTTANIADITTGHLWLYIVADKTNTSYAYVNTRFEYIDN